MCRRSIGRGALWSAQILLLLAGCGSGATRAGAGGTGGAAGAGGGRDAEAGTPGGGAGAGGVAGAGAAVDAGSDAAKVPCDRTGDGLDDAPACVTSPVTLRFVNASAHETFDVWVTGASAPVTTGLAPDEVFTIGPVQARALDVEFRRPSAAPVALQATLAGGTHDTLVVYDNPAPSPAAPATAWAPQPPTGDCGGSSADVDFGDFTSLLPAPVIVFYATNGGADWTPVVSPGLDVGQIFGSGCWNAGASIVVGAGPTGATRAAESYQPTSFAATQSYQLLLTDDRIIQIDGQDRVFYLARAAGPHDAAADARD